VYFVSEMIDQLDLRAIESYYEREERGLPPYHPRMMTKLLVYGCCVGVFSSRKLEKRVIEDIAFRVLAAGNEPDFRSISEFRRVHLKALEGLLEQVLRLALKLGAMKLGRVAIDGSKMKATASKYKAMKYQRIEEEQKRLQEEARRLLAEAEQVDKEENKRYGRSSRGDELPAGLERRQERMRRIAEAKRELEERARAEGEEKKDAKAKQAKPEPKAQHNFTDPQSRIMKGAGRVRAGLQRTDRGRDGAAVDRGPGGNAAGK
jgi:transposase